MWMGYNHALVRGATSKPMRGSGALAVTVRIRIEDFSNRRSCGSKSLRLAMEVGLIS